MDVDALDAQHLKARGFHLGLHRVDALPRPNVAGRGVVERGDYAGYAGNLPNLRKRYGVKLRAVPAQTHLHEKSRSFLKSLGISEEAHGVAIADVPNQLTQRVEIGGILAVFHPSA